MGNLTFSRKKCFRQHTGTVGRWLSLAAAQVVFRGLGRAVFIGALYINISQLERCNYNIKQLAFIIYLLLETRVGSVRCW